MRDGVRKIGNKDYELEGSYNTKKRRQKKR